MAEKEYDNLIGKKTKQASLIDALDVTDEERKKLEGDEDKEWQKHWKGMPEFDQKDNPTYKTVYLHFRSEEDFQAFAKLVDQNLSAKTKSIWYPKLDLPKNSLMRWIEEE